jgi:hypothetical protein
MKPTLLCLVSIIQQANLIIKKSDEKNDLISELWIGRVILTPKVKELIQSKYV